MRIEKTGFDVKRLHCNIRTGHFEMSKEDGM